MARLATNNQPNSTLYGSSVVNGQLVANATTRQIFPSQAAAPYMYGNGSKPATLAGFAPGMGTPLSLAAGDGIGIGGGPGVSDNPWHPTQSPVIWAIAFLIIGFVGLRHVHWRAA